MGNSDVTLWGLELGAGRGCPEVSLAEAALEQDSPQGRQRQVKNSGCTQIWGWEGAQADGYKESAG